MGSDALYVTLESSLVYKLDIVKDLHENDFVDRSVLERELNEFLAFETGLQVDEEIQNVLELDNESDVWRMNGNSPDLLSVVTKDARV